MDQLIGESQRENNNSEVSALPLPRVVSLCIKFLYLS